MVLLWSKFYLFIFLGVSHRILHTHISSGDIKVWKMGKICKWDDWWCHTLNPILQQLYITTETGRLFFPRRTKQLPLARKANVLGHVRKRTWAHSFTFLRQPRNHMAITAFSLSKNGRFFIRGKCIDNNLYTYHAVLTTKAKNTRLRGFRRSAT